MVALFSKVSPLGWTCLLQAIFELSILRPRRIYAWDAPGTCSALSIAVLSAREVALGLHYGPAVRALPEAAGFKVRELRGCARLHQARSQRRPGPPQEGPLAQEKASRCLRPGNVLLPDLLYASRPRPHTHAYQPTPRIEKQASPLSSTSPPAESMCMRLYLVPNDPERTTLVSPNGVAHYQVHTAKAHRLAAPVLSIRRPADTEGDSLVAEVEWKRFGAHPVVRSHIFDGTMQEMQVRDFLYKLGHHFTPTRYFLGDDNQEYRWKPFKDIGHVLTHLDTGDEVARFSQELVTEGFFRGERKWCLQIQPTTLDVDMIVLTFIIMEKRRRDRVAAEAMKTRHRDEDLAEGGGCEAGGVAG